MLPSGGLLELTPQGLYCKAAGAWIDPWRPVPRALITHAHADHARPGCGEYWATGASEGILRQRLGTNINLIPIEYGDLHRIGEARVSFHSAGHVLGSAQIRLEAGGESWLVSGDYKRDADPSCAPFEPVGRCVHHRGHLWPADLPLEPRLRGGRRDPQVVAGGA